MWYRNYSIKGQTRLKQLCLHLHSHVLTLDSPLPSKEITMKSARTKLQLINIISNEFLDHFNKSRYKKPLIITSRYDVSTYTHIHIIHIIHTYIHERCVAVEKLLPKDNHTESSKFLG